MLFNGMCQVLYTMSCGGGDQLLSLSIDRIYSTAKKGFLLVQHYVPTLDKLRYDVRLDSGMKRFH